MFSRLILATLVAVASASPVARGSNSSAPTAVIKNGTVVGRYSPEYDQDFFLGVPYAQPPVGQLRFANPRPINTSFSESYDASQYSKTCIGYGSDNWNYEGSEDCLYLNVIRPAGCEGQKLPVGFWIHGGGFYEGSGVDQRYNMSYIVQNSVKLGKPIIGVGINYRLSAWGFLNAEQLAGEGSTNMGLRDQRLAMHWIQENIEAFGGDSSKVTIWGESAGAASVGAHLTAYNGRDDKLFRAAIMESGNPIAYTSYNGTLSTQPRYNTLVAGVNCSQAFDTLACLRKVPFSSLNAVINNTASGLISWSPVLDGDFIQRYGSIQLAEGDFVKVPIIDGANSDEGTAFSPRGVNTTEDVHNAILARQPLPPALVDQLIDAYPNEEGYLVPLELPGNYTPGPAYGAQYRRSAAISGDIVFIAARRATVEAWASFGIPAYSYRFNAIPAGIPQDIGVTHFQEVAFVFYNLLGTGYIPAAEPPFDGKPVNFAELSRQMDSSWVSFIHDLDPNTAGTSQWPVYSTNAPQNWVWDANVTSYAEPDTWRSEGISLINQNAAGAFDR